MTSSPTAAPRVSICLPNLNTRPFLPERLRTIVEQTFTDWELLAYDSFSNDGAWEYLRDAAAREPRMRAWQGPRAGTPGSWTPCVREARGEYVYIATSDDTMANDCLAKLVAALDAHPECDIAHCALRPIDETGHEIPTLAKWWVQESPFAVSSGDMRWHPHVRRAPFDGALQLLGGSVYISITQLLIRRSLFDRIGYFAPTWGSVGDFNWCMRAGLVAHTIHVPDTWGGWRVHSAQATAAVSFGSPAHAQTIDAMIDDALAACLPMLSPRLQRTLARAAVRARGLRHFMNEVAARRQLPAARRRMQIVGGLLTDPAAARDYLTDRLLRRSPLDWIRDSLDSAAAGPYLVPEAAGHLAARSGAAR